MANRITELVTRLIARDDASKVIEHVADDLDKLEKRPDVEVGIGVDDRTEAGVREIDRRLDGLSAEDKQIVVRAQLRDAQREVDRLARSLKDVDKLDDEEVKIRVEALGNARAELKAIEDQAERLDKEKVDVEVDADTTGIRGKFRQLQTDIATQTTALGKLSTIGSTALSGLATYGPQAAAVAATAVATAVTKMVTDFQTLALEAGKASDALGMSPEDVSRLMEVTGDLGIAWGTVQTAIGRMNRTAETTPDRLEQIGAAIRRSDEGVLDVVGTFQSVVDALDSIPDAGQRAAAGQQIFGKSWAQMAELIEGGADRLVTAMDEVGEGKVVDREEVANARQLRDSIDVLVDQVGEFAGTIGSELSPALSQLADGLGIAFNAVGELFEILQGDFDVPVLDKVVRYLNPITGGFNVATDAVGKLNDEWDDFRGNVEGTVGPMVALGDGLTDAERAISQAEAAIARQTEATKELYSSTEEGARNLGLLQEAQDEAREAAEEHITALEEEARIAEEMAGGFQSLADIQLDLADAQREQNRLAKDKEATDQQRVDNALRIAELEVAQYEAMLQAAGATATATEKLDAQNTALLKQADTLKGPARTEMLNYIGTLNGIPPEKMTEIETLLDEGKFERAERKIRRLSENREATVVWDADTEKADAAREALAEPIETDMLINPRVGAFTARQGGGVVPRGGEIAIVGERGREIVALPGGSRVYSAPQTQQMLTGGSSSLTAAAAAVHYHVNVMLQAGVIGDPFAVSRAVEDTLRRAARLMPRNP